VQLGWSQKAEQECDYLAGAVQYRSSREVAAVRSERRETVAGPRSSLEQIAKGKSDDLRGHLGSSVIAHPAHRKVWFHAGLRAFADIPMWPSSPISTPISPSTRGEMEQFDTSLASQSYLRKNDHRQRSGVGWVRQRPPAGCGQHCSEASSEVCPIGGLPDLSQDGLATPVGSDKRHHGGRPKQRRGRQISTVLPRSPQGAASHPLRSSLYRLASSTVHPRGDSRGAVYPRGS
jgi:hypothetical protein